MIFLKNIYLWTIIIVDNIPNEVDTEYYMF